MKRLAILSALLLAGCAGRTVTETQVVSRPVPVYCHIKIPADCKEAYAIDRVSPADDPLLINRAMRIELEEREICEIKLRAAILGCNTTPTEI